MKELSVDEVLQLIEKKVNIEIIDVREEFEFEEIRIPNAKNIPLGELPERADELNKSSNYIIVCRSGGRSSVATQFLTQLGYNAANMRGGMLNWHGPVETF